MLASCGVLVSERREAGGEALWEADQGRSFARGAELTPAEAAALELVCRPLVDDPTFPLADDLRFAPRQDLALVLRDALGAARTQDDRSTLP